MKKKFVTYAGDYFFYGFLVFCVFLTVACFATPTRTFLLEEFSRLLDHKGKVRAITEFDKKLALHGISRNDFKPEIRIIKRNRELQIISNNKIVAAYPIGLGRATIGAKYSSDDQKTPEGNYRICNKDENFKYHLFLQINYPSNIDAERALLQQIIKHSEYDKIVEAWSEKLPPPANTGLGGKLGIHGYGAESSWTTDGSISMHNSHMEELYWNIEENTLVAILP